MNKSKSAIVLSTIVEKIQLIVGIFLAIIFGACTIISIAEPLLGASGFLVFCIIVDAISVILIVFSRKRHNLIRDFKSYVAILSNDPTGSIENLAASSGTSVDVVKKNLQKMIDRKYFYNATIDHSSNCIILPNRKDYQTVNRPVATSASNGNTIKQQSQRNVTMTTNISGLNAENAAEFNKAVSQLGNAFAKLDDALADFIDENYADEYAAFNEGSDSTNPSSTGLVTITCKGCGGISTLLKGQIGECEYCGSTIHG